MSSFSEKHEVVSLTKVMLASALFSAIFSALFASVAVNHARNVGCPLQLEDRHHLEFGESAFMVPEDNHFKKFTNENHSAAMIMPILANNRVLRRGDDAEEEGTVVTNIFNAESEYIYACSKEKGDKVRFVESLDECKKKEIGHMWSRNGEAGKFIFCIPLQFASCDSIILYSI